MNGDVIAAIVLPPVLAKAADDEWSFLLETKSGQQFIFGSIEVVDKDWIHLNPVDPDYSKQQYFAGPPRKPDAHFIEERGIDIRLDTISWVADGTS